MTPDTITRLGYVYHKPAGAKIERGAGTEKLYQLEEQRDAAIRRAAEELWKVLAPLGGFWLDIMPEELLSILDSYDRTASQLAAGAYLESQGWTVEPPAEKG